MLNLEANIEKLVELAHLRLEVLDNFNIPVIIDHVVALRGWLVGKGVVPGWKEPPLSELRALCVERYGTVNPWPIVTIQTDLLTDRTFFNSAALQVRGHRPRTTRVHLGIPKQRTTRDIKALQLASEARTETLTPPRLRRRYRAVPNLVQTSHGPKPDAEVTRSVPWHWTAP